MRLAVDAMGGDHAPDAIVRGVLDSLPDLAGDDEIALIGCRADIEEILVERGVNDDRLSIVDASQVIGMDESPAEAVKTKKDSSIVKMALLGSQKTERPYDCVLSAGNTGACVSAAQMHMRRLRGVKRTGIAVPMPCFHGPVVLCDAGANPQPRPAHLWQYGLMAETFAKQALGVENPRVGLMNIGAEEAKGTGLIREVHELLKITPGMNYVGYVEGRDFFDGVADVVVTDGFVGNTVLKMAEGLAKSLFSAIANEIATIDPDLFLRFQPVVKQIYAKNDYHEYGGAPLLGVNGVCVIAHGSSEARTIRSAIRNARSFVAARVNEAIVKRLESVAAIEQHHREPV